MNDNENLLPIKRHYMQHKIIDCSFKFDGRNLITAEENEFQEGRAMCGMLKNFFGVDIFKEEVI